MIVARHFALWLMGLAQPETQTTLAERECLSRHAAGKRRLAEVGVWHGVTTRCLRSVMARSGVLYAIDPYPVGRLGFSAQRIIAVSTVGKVHVGTVRWIRTSGADAAKRIATEQHGFDLVFLDGDHSYDGLQQDWLGWASLVASSGVIAIHDSCSSPSLHIENAGSARYTRDVVAHDPRFELVDQVDTLSVFRRNSQRQATHARPI